MKSLAMTYAHSLFSLAEDEGLVDKIYEELISISKIFSENPDYEVLLDSPTIPAEKRFELIDEAFNPYMEYVTNLIKILCEKRRIHILRDCVKEYDKLYYEKLGIKRVTAITATKLSDELREKLIKKLEQEWGKKVELAQKVDPSILGGIVLRTDNSQTDASVRTKLEQLKAQITSNDFR
ncbi:MAG: F0F1 ATP synthase subunit delta [Clostridia bacterium]|nr:F0F1 ATP synthase subunit delta [Clostridia bacterium]